MPNDNLKSLQALLKVFNTERIVSPEDVQAVLTGITSLLANFKRQNDVLNADTKAVLDQALTSVAEQLNQLRQDNADKLSQSGKAVEEKLKQTLQQAQSLVAEARAAMPKDGKDANPADVVSLVMEQIKLPEQKDVILDGGPEIVTKINGLETEDDEQKIDASHIKNLPPASGSVRVMGGARNITVYDETTVIAKVMRFLKFVGAGVQATAVGDVITVTIPGASTANATDELATDSGDHQTFTISHTPTANTLLVINESTGQAIPSSSYTNPTTNIIFNASQQVDDGTGTLVTPTFRARYFY